MKKIFLLALSLALTLCACSPADKIPSLEAIVENGAEWGNEQLQQAQGCTLADLEKAWGKADGELSGLYGYFWNVTDTVSVTVYYHKDAEIEYITVTGLDDGDISGGAGTSSSGQPNDPSLQDISVSVAEAGGGDAFELLGEDAETISQILSADSWVPDATDCASDYIVTYNGRTIYYHSECGTFNERLEQSNQSLHISETERGTVNEIIKGVIPHDLNSDAPYVNTEANKVNTTAATETTVPDNNLQTPAVEPDNRTPENVTEIFDALNSLEYQPYTCDGLPEYLLYAADGTVYSINFSERWIWRGNNEQAELPDELIGQLKASGSLIASDGPLEAP